MHHEVQKLGNLGLKWLSFGWGVDGSHFEKSRGERESGLGLERSIERPRFKIKPILQYPPFRSAALSTDPRFT
jgi:hypothetical protein